MKRQTRVHAQDQEQGSGGAAAPVVHAVADAGHGVSNAGPVAARVADAVPDLSNAPAQARIDVMRACTLLSRVGASLVSVSKELGCDEVTLWRVLNRSEFSEMYARARELRAQQFAEDMQDDVRAVRSGTLAPDAGRVVLGGLQWLAERMDGRRWSANQKHEVSGPGGGPIEVSGARARVLAKLGITDEPQA